VYARNVLVKIANSDPGPQIRHPHYVRQSIKAHTLSEMNDKGKEASYMLGNMAMVREGGWGGDDAVKRVRNHGGLDFRTYGNEVGRFARNQNNIVQYGEWRTARILKRL